MESLKKCWKNLTFHYFTLEKTLKRENKKQRIEYQATKIKDLLQKKTESDHRILK